MRRLNLAASLIGCAGQAAPAEMPQPSRTIYAVNESASDRGSISVYDIDAGHRLVRTIRTVPEVADVRGVAGSAATGKLYVAYTDASRRGMIYSLDVYTSAVLWNKEVPVGVDRPAISPDGQLIYSPTSEANTADFIQVLDANTGEVARKVYFSRRSHDTQYPLSGPVFQETKADDGSGNYLYLIDPSSYAVSKIGPYAGILGPYAVDGASHYVVNDVTNLWGMQVADLKTGRIVTATIPGHPPGNPRLPHGIGWTPDQSEVWQSGPGNDPHVYIWDMRDPMAPVLRQRLSLRNGHGSHWVTFDMAEASPASSGS